MKHFIKFSILTLFLLSSTNHFAAYRRLFTTKINLPDHRGFTPLMYASQRGFEDIVKLLLKAKADLNLKNNAGKTALDLANNAGHNKISDLLRTAGAKTAQQIKEKE